MSISQDSLKRYNERARFLPVVSGALCESDKTYQRKLLTEAQLKAICSVATSSNFTLSETCSTCTAKVIAAASLCNVLEEDFRDTVKIADVDGYPRFAYFEINRRATKQYRLSDKETCEDYLVRILRCLNCGIALFPLHMLGSVAGKSPGFESIRLFLENRTVQVRVLSETFDTLLQQYGGDFDKLLNCYADWRDCANAAAFRFNVKNRLQQLIASGHTEDL